MRIRHLTIINFRVIEHFDSDFSPAVNAFIGDNGAGKSSVLEALKILYSWLAARIRSPKGNGRNISSRDIRNGADFCFLQVEVEDGGSTYQWQLYRQRRTYRGKPSYKTSLTNMSEWASKLAERKGGTALHWPFAAFYGVARSISNPPLRIRKRHKLEALDLYDKSALDAGADFEAFFYWFREKEDLENEQRLEQNIAYRDLQLQSIRRSVEAVFSSFSGFRVNRRDKSFEISKDGEVFRFSQLSDGEKCYLGLVMDVARILSITASGEEDSLTSTNVIVIDEIDLHLHPSWQRDVLDRLRQAFPHCQFFVSTHSPYVLSSMDTSSDVLFKITGGETRRVERNTFGREVGELLIADFGQKSLRNDTVAHLLQKAWHEADSQKPDKQAFDEAMELLNRYIPDDIEIVKLKLAWSRKEAQTC